MPVVHSERDWVCGEEATCRVKCTIQDYDGTYIGSGMITSATYTIWNEKTATSISGYVDVDISSDISALGVLSFVIPTTANALVDTATGAPEWKVCALNIVGTDGDGKSVVIRDDVRYQVIDVIGVRP